MGDTWKNESAHWQLLEQLGAHQPAIPDADEPVSFSSPPCQMAHTDPAYHGFDAAAEIIEQLNVLLEAERAGALVCAQTLKQTPAGALHDLLRTIQQDEVKSCQGLLHSIHLLGGTASTRIGDFHRKAMAIEDVDARLQLLDRGQAWVVRQLDALLPRVMQPDVSAQLRIMRDDHVCNIEKLRNSSTH